VHLSFLGDQIGLEGDVDNAALATISFNIVLIAVLRNIMLFEATPGIEIQGKRLPQSRLASNSQSITQLQR
jgi:hypothetical protein